MATVDVTVMGAGVFGLTIAYECVRRGAAVQVIDPRGAGAGSSGGVVGALAPHTPERWEPKKAFQLDSLLMAQGFWDGVDGLSGLASGYGRVGRLQAIADDWTLQLARERIAQARDLWRGQAEWQVREAREFDGWVPPSASGYVVHDTLSARIDPGRACDSLVAALAAFDVAIEKQGTAQSAVVWATGYEGLLALSEEFGCEVGNGVKGQSVLLKYDRRDVPQIFVEGIHFVAHDNGTVAIGSTSERYFDDPVSTDEQLDELLAQAIGILPQLADAPVLGRWAGVRPRAKTRAPMLGGYPGRAGGYIANGGFKIGFGMAPKVAVVMADLVLDGVDGIPDEFRVEANL
ncbi:MAG: FAD-dependent oxidoreductase [Paracoccaceae bacterium]